MLETKVMQRHAADALPSSLQRCSCCTQAHLGGGGWEASAASVVASWWGIRGRTLALLRLLDTGPRPPVSITCRVRSLSGGVRGCCRCSCCAACEVACRAARGGCTAWLLDCVLPGSPEQGERCICCRAAAALAAVLSACCTGPASVRCRAGQSAQDTSLHAARPGAASSWQTDTELQPGGLDEPVPDRCSWECTLTCSSGASKAIAARRGCAKR